MYEYNLECRNHGVYAVIESPILYEGNDGSAAPALLWSKMQVKESILPCIRSAIAGTKSIGLFCDTPSKDSNGHLHIDDICNEAVISLTEKGLKALAIEKQVNDVLSGANASDAKIPDETENAPPSEFLDNMAAITQLKGEVLIRFSDGQDSKILPLNKVVFFNSEFPPFVPAIPKEITNIVNWSNVAAIVIEREEEETISEKSNP